MTAKVVFDGAEFEVSESVALAITKEREDAKMSFEDMKKKYDELVAAADSMKSEMDAMEGELKGKMDAAEGRADALAEQVEELKGELEAAKQINLDSMVEERVALVEKAKAVLDSDYEFSGKSDREVMVDSIKAVRGDSVALDEKSDDYVLAMFDTIAEAGRSDSATTDELRKAVASIASPVAAPSSYMDRLQNAWKAPLSISKEAK
jgi:prophage DNA circulation protein